MSGARQLVAGFLAADGFAVELAEGDLLIAERQTPTAALDRRLLWVPDQRAAGMSGSGEAMLAEIGRCLNAAGKASLFLIVSGPDGLGAEFRRLATSLYGLKIRSYAQFFDTPYKQDGEAEFGAARSGGRTAASIAQDFLADELIEKRVPQPYLRFAALGSPPRVVEADLAMQLIGQMSELPDESCLRIVVGAAGAGKSILFQALYTGLYRAFMQAKREHRLASRPILFLPEHIHQGEVKSLDGLIDQVLSTDVAGGAGPQLFQWMNDHGFNTWMFDGLDEFFGGDPAFVRLLERKLDEGPNAQVLICARDSLLTSSTVLRSFVERRLGRPNGRVELYELASWSRPSQKFLATLRMTGEVPRAEAPLNPDVERFMLELARSPAVASLASLPYYADLLVRIFQQQGGKLPTKQFELLEQAVDSLIDREHGKLVFDWDVFMGEDSFLRLSDSIKGFNVERFRSAADRERLEKLLSSIGRQQLRQLLEAIAHLVRMEVRRPSESGGLSVQELIELGSLYTDAALTSDLEQRVLLAIVQFAFFGAGRERGTIRFTHELLADYLAGCHAANLIAEHGATADAIGQAVGVREEFEWSLALQTMVHRLSADLRLRADVIAAADSQAVRERHQPNARALGAALLGEHQRQRETGR